MRKSSKLSNYRLIGVDTNIFVYHFSNNLNFIDKTNLIFKLLGEKRISAVTSIITISELLAFDAPKSVLDKISESFFSTPNLTISDVTQKIALAAARIRRENKFALPDAIQVATSLDAKAQTFITNDKRLKNFKELQIILLTEIA